MAQTHQRGTPTETGRFWWGGQSESGPSATGVVGCGCGASWHRRQSRHQHDGGGATRRCCHCHQGMSAALAASKALWCHRRRRRHSSATQGVGSQRCPASLLPLASPLKSSIKCGIGGWCRHSRVALSTALAAIGALQCRCCWHCHSGAAVSMVLVAGGALWCHCCQRCHSSVASSAALAACGALRHHQRQLQQRCHSRLA